MTNQQMLETLIAIALLLVLNGCAAKKKPAPKVVGRVDRKCAIGWVLDGKSHCEEWGQYLRCDGVIMIPACVAVPK
jgi:hypothetical protein